MRLPVVVIGIACAVILCSPASAAAPPPLRSLGVVPDTVRSDGSRFAMYQPTAGSVVVFDDAKGMRFRRRLAPSCEPQNLRRTFVVLLCGDRYRILDAATGRLVSPPLAPAAADPYRTGRGYFPPQDGLRDAFYEIGTHWLSGLYQIEADGPNLIVYLNWRTGERRVLRPPLRDIDSPRLRPLHRWHCAGAPFPWLYGPRPTAYEVTLSDETTLALYPCGGSPNVFAHCDEECGIPQQGEGIVTWGDVRNAGAYFVLTGETWNWSFPSYREAFRGDEIRALHTRRRILISLPLRHPSLHHRARLYEVCRPRLARRDGARHRTRWVAWPSGPGTRALNDFLAAAAEQHES